MADRTPVAAPTHITRASGSIALRLCGVPISVAGLPQDLQARFCDIMRPFLVQSDRSTACGATPSTLDVRRQPDGEMAIIRDGEIVAAFVAPDLLLTQLEWHAITIALRAMTSHAVIHGAAFVRGSSVVLLVADSGAGKTTITLGMMRRGWLPLSDDIVLIDTQTLAVRPFPRCFHVDGSSESLALDESLVERPGGLPEYVRPLRWAEGGLRPTAILLVERCQTCFSRLGAVALAEVAGALGFNAIRSGLPRSELARVAVRIAATVHRGGRLFNARFEDTLDLIESLSE